MKKSDNELLMDIRFWLGIIWILFCVFALMNSYHGGKDRALLRDILEALEPVTVVEEV